MENETSNPISDRYPNPIATVDVDVDVAASNSLPSSSRRRSGLAEWPTIDGPLGLSHEESVTYARRFFKLGFFCLPFLWAVNCFYFWPVLRHPHSHHSYSHLRWYLVGSAIGFLVFTTILSSWVLTFATGGERLFGHVWDELVMYNVAERYGLTGWI